MLIDMLNILLTLPLPWVLGALVVSGIAVWLVGRKPKPRAPARHAPHPSQPPPAPHARQAPPSPSVPAPPRPAAPQFAQQRVSMAPPPATRAPAPTAAAAPPSKATAATALAKQMPLHADLLLVDDSAVVRAKLRRLFEPDGYRVALARDGVEALALLQAGRYALLITDLEMPRLDGLGLVRAVQQQSGWAAMPILAITGHDDLQDELNQLQAVTGIHRKPWIDGDLLGQVRALVQPSLEPAQQAED